MIAIGYVRRSKESEEKTVSLDTQKEQIGQYCDRLGFDLVHFVVDDGVSGTLRSRFASLDEAIAEFKPSQLVYYHQDRIARDVGLSDYFKTLIKRRIEVHETNGAGKIDIKSATGRMIVNIRSAVDAAYAELIGEKTSHALRHKKESGKRYTNIPPIGFRYVDGLMIEDEEEQRGLVIMRECVKVGFGARRSIAVLKARAYAGRMSVKGIHQAIQRIKTEGGEQIENVSLVGSDQKILLPVRDGHALD